MSDDADIRSTTQFKMAWAKIIARANYDPAFCHQLQHDPIAVLRAYGIDAPADLNLNEKVHPKLSEALNAMQHAAPAASAPSANCATSASASTAHHQHVHLMAPFSQPQPMYTWFCPSAQPPHAQPMFTFFSVAHPAHAQPQPMYTWFCPSAHPPPVAAPHYTHFSMPHAQTSPVSLGASPPGQDGNVHAMFTFFCGSAA